MATDAEMRTLLAKQDEECERLSMKHFAHTGGYMTRGTEHKPSRNNGPYHIVADDTASISIYSKDGQTKLCTVNCFDLTHEGEALRGCIDVIPNNLKANALVFKFKPADKEPVFSGENNRYRMTSNGIVAVELRPTD